MTNYAQIWIPTLKQAHVGSVSIQKIDPSYSGWTIMWGEHGSVYNPHSNETKIICEVTNYMYRLIETSPVKDSQLIGISASLGISRYP